MCNTEGGYCFALWSGHLVSGSSGHLGSHTLPYISGAINASPSILKTRLKHKNCISNKKAFFLFYAN